MTTYLITGGAGFIGSHYIHYLFRNYEDTIQVINADKLTYAANLDYLKDIQEKKNYYFYQADVCDGEIMREFFREYEIDRVVHFAAESHVDRSIAAPADFVKTNILGTQVLLEAAREAWEQADGCFGEGKRFLHISTDEVYGSLGATGCFYEDSPYAPHSPYAASKASADLLVRSYMDTYGFPAMITHCTNNYGPCQFPEKLVPLMIQNALEGKALPVYGDGKNVRDWIYVEDHVKALDLVLEKGRLFETYNIGGHNEMTNVELVQRLLDLLPICLPENDKRRERAAGARIVFVEDRKGHDRRYAVSTEKIEKETGWSAKTRFEDGLRKTIMWYADYISSYPDSGSQ